MYIDYWLWLLYQIPITSLSSTIAMAINWITASRTWNGWRIPKMQYTPISMAYTNPLSEKDGSSSMPVPEKHTLLLRKLPYTWISTMPLAGIICQAIAPTVHACNMLHNAHKSKHSCRQDLFPGFYIQSYCHCNNVLMGWSIKEAIQTPFWFLCF